VTALFVNGSFCGFGLMSIMNLCAVTQLICLTYYYNAPSKLLQNERQMRVMIQSCFQYHQFVASRFISKAHYYQPLTLRRSCRLSQG